MRQARTLMLAVSLATASTPAFADTVLRGFAGSWTGDGWARGSADEPKQAVRCRVEMGYDPGSGWLEFSGRCAGTGSAGRFRGHLVKGTGNVYRGTWQGDGETGARPMTARAAGHGLQFSLSGATATEPAGSMGWRLRGNVLEIISAGRRNGKLAQSSVTLRRR